MKHKRLAAAVLAAALWLTGCGGAAAPAAPAGPALSPRAPQTRRCRQHKKDRITEQFALEKDHPGRVRHHPEADHPCAAACVLQPGCRLSQR